MAVLLLGCSRRLEFDAEHHLLALGLRAEDRRIDQIAGFQRLKVFQAFLTLAADNGTRTSTGEKLDAAGMRDIGRSVRVLTGERADFVSGQHEAGNASTEFRGLQQVRNRVPSLASR
jgi:hypothetical protein